MFHETMRTARSVVTLPVKMSLEALCLKCGLCCDGTLFTHVALTVPEAERLKGRVELQSNEQAGVLRQPCSALERCKCTVYADRPQGCARFVCMLGAALSDGEVGFDEASAVVAQAQALRDAINRLVPGIGTPIGRARQYEERGPDSTRAVEVREARRALEAFVRKHFLGRSGT
jgi:Fe-S-cluster containining protein